MSKSSAKNAPFDIANLSDDKRAKIYHAVKESAAAMTRARAEGEYVRETAKKIVSETEIPKKIFGKLVKTYFKQNFEEEVSEHEMFERLYVNVTSTVKRS